MDLLQAAEEGDQAAFEDIFREFTPILGRIASLYVGEDWAPDITQEVMFKVHKALADPKIQFRHPAALFGWLKIATINQSHDFLRARGRTETISLDEVHENPDARILGLLEVIPHSKSPDPEAVILDREGTGEIMDEIHKLTPAQQRVIKLRYMGELKYREISAQLGIPENTVKVRVSRARATFRKRYLNTAQIP